LTHIEKLIDVLNYRLTYGDIINLFDEQIIIKNNADIIKNVLKDLNLFNYNCYEEIIWIDEELKNILEQSQLSNH